ncbi:hypothetical protein DPMN_065379 [Dreissena polymorpha]|uniref:Uncharacterized protein n=1 Tax=Dreissena polymorpha TaxID=45954 RepID=A0A9D3YVW4_DREPO|nr:hypothetical protein DPMN_065379 [Dreissena polymorpha]
MAFSVVLIILLSSDVVFAASLSDTENLMSNLTNGYNVNIRPAVEQLSPVDVSVQLYLKSIIDFDDVQGILSFTTGIRMTWMDYRLQWDPNGYGGLQTLSVPLSHIWFPQLFLSTPATDRSYFAESWSKATLSNTGDVVYLEMALIQSTCDVNVKYYPYDIQSCNTSFALLGYTKTEVNLMRLEESIDLTLYLGNSMWDLESTHVSVETIHGGIQEMLFTFNIRRKNEYSVVNVLLPILFLGTLNAFVFLLIPESGERVGYSITTLLAIAVYMTIIMSSLPQSSDPMPLIFYKLLVDLTYSALIMVVVILNMRLHGKDDNVPVPKSLVSFYLALTCTDCGGKAVSPESDGFTTDQIAKGWGESNSMNSVDAQKVTWKKVSSLLDTIFFVLFVVLSIISFAVFIAVMKVGA